MSWSRSVSSCLFSLALAGCSARPAVQVSSETARPRAEDPIAASSPVFDGKSVTLRAARGETLGLLVRASGKSGHQVRLEMAAPFVTVKTFELRSLEVREPSTDMYGATRGRGSYPDVLVPVTGRVVGAGLAFFDLVVPNTTPPGQYQGQLVIDARRFPIVLDVSCARIDLERDPLVWAFYLPSEIARAHGVPDDDGPREIALERSYHALFRAHGVLLASDLPPGRFRARREFVRDTRFWPVAIDTRTDASIASDVSRWLDVFRDGSVTPFAIPVDEPQTAERRRFARHVGEVIGRAGGGHPRLLRAVTDRASAEYGDAMDVFISPANLPALARSWSDRRARFWTYNGRPPQAGSMVLDSEAGALRTWGWIAERYDVELWYAWEALYWSDRYNQGGPTDVSSDPVTFDERSRGGEDHGNGDGVLAYPGPLPSLRLKVLRRGLSDRLLVRELRACAGDERARGTVERVVPRALGEASRSEGPSWPRDEVRWESARSELLDGIEECCHGR